MFTILAMRLGLDFAETGRMTGLLLLASEALVVVLTVFRRPTGIVDRSPRARVLTMASLIGPILVGPAALLRSLPELATVLLIGVRPLRGDRGKLSLGRSFGLMPANRGRRVDRPLPRRPSSDLPGLPDHARRLPARQRYAHRTC